MTIHLVTFSDDSMSRSAELCVESARKHGIEGHADIYTRAGIEYSGWADGPQFELLELMDANPRGCGFWAWKPFVIFEAMMMCGKDDTLIYSDAGIEFINSVNYIIDRMDQDIFLFGNQWEHAHWCKRDIIEAVWPMDFVTALNQAVAESEAERHRQVWKRFGKQVQASVIFFRVSDYSRAFVKEWLDWCLFEGGRLIDDSPSRTPNHPEFRENRHDQAILTTLAYREGIRLHYWPANYNDGAFEYPRGDYPDEGYPILFHHHRKRNHEWSNAA